MKIGILTQPLYCNYGGMLQCYALQTYLKRMGHEAIVLQRENSNAPLTIKQIAIYYVKHIAKLLMGRESSWHYRVTPERKKFIAQHTSKFIEKNINPRSEKCHSTQQLKQLVDELHLDAIVVGSDQVWRPDYSPCITNYFLDFLEADSSIRRISYAASFGTDQWLYSPSQTADCSDLLKKFNAVSVREQSAVGLCKEHFGVVAQHVIDPTMLLEVDDYMSLAPTKLSRGNLFCYILDRSPEMQSIKTYVTQKTQKRAFENMPALFDSAKNLYDDIEKCVYPPTEEWISGFAEAEMVITDSFHGCVFSIIFNKPFWVVGNEGRGMARFASLLAQFGLEDRLVTASSIHNTNLDAPIDWERVNNLRKHFQTEANKFFILALHV